MRVNRVLLRNMIASEMKVISEGCGCGCKGAPGGCGDNILDVEPLVGYESAEDHLHSEISQVEDQFMTREESLKAVVAIALSTTCPMTRDSLLSAVEDLL